MKFYLYLLFLFVTGISRLSFAQEILATEIPSSFQQSNTTLIERGVGSGCLAMTLVRDGLPCSPSMLGRQKENTFIGQVFLGNGYTALKTTNKVLNEPMSKEYLKSLFSQNSVMEMEADAQLTFITKGFAAQFAPYHVTYYSVIRNNVYPIIALHAMNERSFKFAAGHEVYKGLLVGANTRFVTRKFIHKEFSLLEAVTTEPDTLLAPKTQNAFYAEPAVTYFLPVPWKPRVTVMGQNLGFVDTEYAELNYKPTVVGGLGAQLPVRYGTWEIDLDYRTNRNTGKIEDNLYFGTTYKLGAVQGMMGVNTLSFSTGVAFGLDFLHVGVVYSATKMPYEQRDDYNQTVYTQFGVRI